MTMDTTINGSVGGVVASKPTTKPAAQSAPTTTNGKPKEKRRSNEKRKEKSRDAARCRRFRETEIFTELAQVLPLPKEDVDQLDKASVMRVAIAYLKIRQMLQLFPKIKDLTEITTDSIEIKDDDDEASEKDEKEEKPFDLWKTIETNKLLKQSLDGFLLILSNEGDVTYVSENITEFLGISKIDILGQLIWEYSHQCDHEELKEALNIKKNGLSEKVKDENLIEEGITTDHRDLFLRLKCTLTSRGRSVNIKSATYKVIHLTGHLVVNAKGDRVLIAVGRPIPHPSNIEIPLGTTTFLTKHSLDMKFTYVDDKMTSLFGYKPEDLLDKSLYECHHGADSDSLMSTFKCALSKGQGETCRYRFLGKCGGYCWIVTQATIVYDKQKPQSVVCVNYVISNLENNNEIYSLAQYEASQLEKTESNQTSTTAVNSNITTSNQSLQQQQSISHESIELTENKPKPIHQLSPQQHDEDQKLKDQLQVDLENSLQATLSKKTCVDVDEKKSTSAGELQLKREIPISTENPNNSNNPIIDQVKYVPSVTSFRALQHRPQQKVYDRVVPSTTSATFTSPAGLLSSSPPKLIEDKRPKSVTASVFRVAPEKPAIINQNLISQTIVVNQANLSQLNLAPRAQSVTASVITPISQHQSQILQSKSTQIKQQQQSQQQQQQHQQQPSTVHRTVEMNKGYLSFAEDTTGLTMLKEEPDDLVHLAPTGVDACLPLDESTPLFGEMLAGLMSTYGGLLAEDINSLDSQHSGNQTAATNNNKGHIDPFINFREESNDTNCSQHLLSPSVTSKSPEASSLPSLCSPNSLSQEDEFSFMTMNDLSMRAPYIPMNEQDDLPLLTDDLMWGVGFTSDDLAIHKDDAMQYNTLKQQLNLTADIRMVNTNSNHNSNNCNSPNLINSSPSASPMSISSSSAASSPSPCSSNSSISMHNQQSSSFGGAMLCNGSGGGGGGDGSGGGNSVLNVDDSDSGISSINSMSPQHSHNHHHQQQQQHHHRNQHQQQQQNHQQRHSPMSIGSDSLGLMTCKKELEGTSLCESIDAFDSVYTKDSSNLDWTVQELLNINSNDSNVAVDDLRQTHKQQNIIINTATIPTTNLHVPLITIQNNKNLSLNQQRMTATSPSSGTIVTATSSSSPSSATVSLSSSSNCHNTNSNSNKQQQHQQQQQQQQQQQHQQKQQCGGNLILSEEIIQNNRKLTGKVPTSNTAATIRISNGNLSISRQQQQQQQQQTIVRTATLQTTSLQGNNHKRHLSTGGASSLDSKRLKNSSTVEIQTSPNLLQQLMAPAPQKQRIVVKTVGTAGGGTGSGYDKSQMTSRWANDGSNPQQQQQLLRNHQQDSNINHHLNQSSLSSSTTSSSSNSVLKNLLISGCDNLMVRTGPEIMITDEISNDSIAQLSPSDSFTPIRCETSTAKVLRSCRSNPMIGGPGVLPSPPFPSDDSNPPALLTMSDTESSSDSGIDETCTPKKNLFKQSINASEVEEKLYANVKSADGFITHIDPGNNSTSIQILPGTSQSPVTTLRNQYRKSSLSFMDNGNPLMTTFLMDLCNDDYNMSESDYLQDNELVQVLNELTNDMVLSDNKD